MDTKKTIKAGYQSLPYLDCRAMILGPLHLLIPPSMLMERNPISDIFSLEIPCLEQPKLP